MTNPPADDIDNQLDVAIRAQALSPLNAVMPFLERMRQEGSVVIIKIDGERLRDIDGGIYTVIVSGQRLSGQPIRIDTDDLLDALSRAIRAYANRFWQSDRAPIR